MESRALQSQTVTTTIPSSLSRCGFVEKPSLCRQMLKLPNLKRYPHNKKLRFLNVRAQTSGTKRISTEVIEAIPPKVGSKHKDLAFVAGATGKVGSRTVRELLKLGFRVRAGVRSAQKAENLVQSVKQMKVDVVNENRIPAVEKLEIVECDLEKPDQIGPALGNASVVLCCIGASEKEIFDITGPYRIDYKAAENLIVAATVAKVDHFLMVSSLGTNKFGFPAAILNLFWGVLIWKRKAEEALIASGLPYTIVRPGGMERPTDSYKETHNITLSQEDTLFGGQVSTLQVAELMAFMAKNRGLSYCKVVEVIAETTAPLTPMEELLKKIPSQRTERKEPDTAVEPVPAPLTIIVSEAPETPVKTEEPTQAKPKVTRPLSPYVAYEDLKPPTSPTPTPSRSTTATKTSDLNTIPAASESTSESIGIKLSEPKALDTEPKKMRPLSPYFVYDDLKPPTSPTPTPPSGKKIDVNVDGPSKPNTSDAQNSSSDTSSIPEMKTAPEVQKTRPLSPYVAYDDFKPPTSPSPNAPTASSLPQSSVDNGSPNSSAQSPATDKPRDKQHHAAPKMRPLSPFTMYEDLKPPTSPIPSLRKS